VAQDFNIVIYTASRKEYADPVIDLIDKSNVIVQRLFRESCIKTRDGWTKDLTKIDDDLGKIILIDNTRVAGAMHPENMIWVGPWFSDENDELLLKLRASLLEFAKDLKNPKFTRKDMDEFIRRTQTELSVNTHKFTV